MAQSVRDPHPKPLDLNAVPWHHQTKDPAVELCLKSKVASHACAHRRMPVSAIAMCHARHYKVSPARKRAGTEAPEEQAPQHTASASARLRCRPSIHMRAQTVDAAKTKGAMALPALRFIASTKTRLALLQVDVPASSANAVWAEKVHPSPVRLQQLNADAKLGMTILWPLW